MTVCLSQVVAMDARKDLLPALFPLYWEVRSGPLHPQGWRLPFGRPAGALAPTTRRMRLWKCLFAAQRRSAPSLESEIQPSHGCVTLLSALKRVGRW